MDKKWMGIIAAVAVVAIVVLIISIARNSSGGAPSGKPMPVKPVSQDEAMRRVRMGAGRPGGMAAPGGMQPGGMQPQPGGPGAPMAPPPGPAPR